MTEGRKLTLEFLLGYFQYLTRWDQSASVTSTIEMIKSMIISGNASDSMMADLELVANYEYSYIKETTQSDIMSISDVYQLLIKESRNKKIEDILG